FDPVANVYRLERKNDHAGRGSWRGSHDYDLAHSFVRHVCRVNYWTVGPFDHASQHALVALYGDLVSLSKLHPLFVEGSCIHRILFDGGQAAPSLQETPHFQTLVGADVQVSLAARSQFGIEILGQNNPPAKLTVGRREPVESHRWVKRRLLLFDERYEIVAGQD